MTQVDVVLTDYGLALECAAFAVWLALPPYRRSPARAWFLVFFSSITLAAAMGGTVHGFFSGQTSLGYRILWPATMIAIGITALSGIHIGSFLQLNESKAATLNRAAMVGFALYSVVVLCISSAFFIAILGYLPSVLFLGVMFALNYHRQGERPFLVGFLGVCTTLLAAGVQQARIDISPRYFSHNALYHVLQGFGLSMVFVTSVKMCRADCRQRQESARAEA